MCGIYACINNRYCENGSEEKNYILCDKHNVLTKRGPDETTIIDLDDCMMAFYRLAIVGVASGHQPFNIDGIRMICNGEIYNYKDLIYKHELKTSTSSDCEVILHMYIKYGIEYTVQQLDGEFAFVLFDEKKRLVHFARDYMGIKPMYYATIHKESDDNKVVMLELASSINAMNLGNKANHVLPRKIYTYDMENHVLSDMAYLTLIGSYNYSVNDVIAKSLTDGILKRITQTERPVGFLLSGGLDSSLVLALALDVKCQFYYNKFVFNLIDEYKKGFVSCSCNGLCEINHKTSYTTFVYRDITEKSDSCVGHCNDCICKLCDDVQAARRLFMPKVFTFGFSHTAPDVISAKTVVDFLYKKYGKCFDWHLVIQDLEDGLKALPEVIETLETYDTTTIRASTPMYLISKYISQNTDVKVLISGEGSDELFGGYLYFKYAPNDQAFRSEIIKLLNDLYMYDVLRADRTTAAWGLEVRPPFLDYHLVTNVLNSKNLVKGVNTTKELLRTCFADKDLLPNEILWGKKEAFSDAVGLSWKDSIAQYASIKIKNSPNNKLVEVYHNKKNLYDIDDALYNLYEEFKDELNKPNSIFNSSFDYCNHIKPVTDEMKYFQMLFHGLCQGAYHLLPSLWLPNQSWVKTGVEPSARVLTVYNGTSVTDPKENLKKKKSYIVIDIERPNPACPQEKSEMSLDVPILDVSEQV